MKITKLEYQKKDPNRVNIYIDEKFTVGIEVGDIIKLGLYKGQEITTEYLDKIISESEFGKMFNAALNFLSFRPRSEWEVRDYLKKRIWKKGETKDKRQKTKDWEKEREIIENQEEINKVIEKLKQIDQVNDLDFAKWWVDQRTTFRQKGNQLIKLELRRKGIGKEIIDSLFSTEDGNSSSEFERAWLAIQKKLRIWDINKLGRIKFKEKVMRFLLSRGFNFDTINSVVEKLMAKE